MKLAILFPTLLGRWSFLIHSFAHQFQCCWLIFSLFLFLYLFLLFCVNSVSFASNSFFAIWFLYSHCPNQFRIRISYFLWLVGLIAVYCPHFLSHVDGSISWFYSAVSFCCRHSALKFVCVHLGFAFIQQSWSSYLAANLKVNLRFDLFYLKKCIIEYPSLHPLMLSCLEIHTLLLFVAPCRLSSLVSVSLFWFIIIYSVFPVFTSIFFLYIFCPYIG